MRIILSLLVVALLAGCKTDSYTWYKPGVTAKQMQQDINEARKQANELPPYSDPFSSAIVNSTETKEQLADRQRRENQLADQMNRERYFRACMKAKGYAYIPNSQKN